MVSPCAESAAFHLPGVDLLSVKTTRYDGQYQHRDRMDQDRPAKHHLNPCPAEEWVTAVNAVRIRCRRRGMTLACT